MPFSTPGAGAAVGLTLAGEADAVLVLDLARAFHAEDGHPLSASGARAILGLLVDPTPGRVLKVEHEGRIIGYAVLCFGYSVEWGGRDAFIDDLYIVPSERGRGLGSAVIHALGSAARRAGCAALHLEVVADNPAVALYRRLGFEDRGSTFLSRRLTNPSP